MRIEANWKHGALGRKFKFKFSSGRRGTGPQTLSQPLSQAQVPQTQGAFTGAIAIAGVARLLRAAGTVARRYRERQIVDEYRRQQMADQRP